MMEEGTEQQPPETEASQQFDSQEEPDLWGIVIAYILCALSPLIGLGVGAALKLTGSGSVKKVGATCIIVSLISLVLWIVLPVFMGMGSCGPGRMAPLSR